MTVIIGLGRLRQEDCPNFKAGLDNRARPCLDKHTHSHIQMKKKKKHFLKYKIEKERSRHHCYFSFGTLASSLSSVS